MALKDSSILVTGLGAFGAAGRNCDELWETCRSGTSRAELRSFSGIQIPAYSAPDPELGRRDAHLVRSAGRIAALGLAAAREAWEDARLSSAVVEPARIGLILGSSRGPADIVDASLGRETKRPSEAVYTAFSSTAGVLASALNIQGCALSVSATCTSGASAIYTGLQLLRGGDLDVVVAGGLDAPLIDSIVHRLAAAGVLSSSGHCRDALRPFDASRDGTVLGEGAAFLVLETGDSARRRQIRVHGRLLGAALSCEPNARSHPAPEVEGLQRAVRAALASGPTSAANIDLLHLHGTGTRINDSLEGVCVNSLFGAPPGQPVSWATKGITGHTLGAASSFQAVLTLLAMRHSHVPPTANCLELDPACQLRLAHGHAKSMRIQTALCLTSGFWGKNSCLAFAAPE
jgi:3-oxoacyl-[acyl-carrier-protein] synthase II